MISVKVKGSFARTENFLGKISKQDYMSILHRFGQLGVDALASATPVKTGLTARSWIYKITTTRRGYRLSWENTNVENGAPVAIILQYGHGTGTGGWVSGRDYINPTIQPIFDSLTEDLWRQVTRG